MTSHAVPLPQSAPRERILVQPVLEGLFLLTIFTVTFHKLQWELAGSLTLSDVLTSVFLVLVRLGSLRAETTSRFTRTAMVAFGFFVRVRAPLPRRLLQPRHRRRRSHSGRRGW